MKGKITIRTLPTVLTKFTHSICKQNILAVLDMHAFCKVCNCITAQWKFLSKYQKIETPWFVNGDDYKDNAPQFMTHTYHAIVTADYNRIDVSLW